MSENSGPKGAFSADISEELVAEALRAVEERAVESALERGDEVPVESEDDGEVIELHVPETEPEPIDEAAARIRALEEELQAKEALLQDSLQRGREMMERLQEAGDRLARQAADFDNARKRAVREREDAQRFAIEKLLKELIPVLDNFDRALEHAERATDVESFAQGVSMTHKLFVDTLGKFGVEVFDAVGKVFDPRIHEAMDHVENHEHGANVVISEMVRGYLLHERLIRPALVSVSKGPGPSVSAGGSGADDSQAGESASSDQTMSD